jgi:hypothetical protein
VLRARWPVTMLVTGFWAQSAAASPVINGTSTKSRNNRYRIRQRMTRKGVLPIRTIKVLGNNN